MQQFACPSSFRSCGWHGASGGCGHPAPVSADFVLVPPAPSVVQDQTGPGIGDPATLATDSSLPLHEEDDQATSQQQIEASRRSHLPHVQEAVGCTATSDLPDSHAADVMPSPSA